MGKIILLSMNILLILEKTNNGENIIFYNKSVFDCYEELQDDYVCIYFNEPTPVKIRLIKMINMLSGVRDASLNRLTIAELKDLLIRELEYKRLIIFFNHFERLTRGSVQVYLYLNTLANIQFVASFSADFKPELYHFYKQFELGNPGDCEVKVRDEINVTYSVYILLSLICFFIYLKTASSIFNAFILLGAAWFALIIFRTLFFVGGRP